MIAKMAKNSLRRNLKSKKRRLKATKKCSLKNSDYNEIKALYQSQEEKQIEIKKLAQSNRSSFMLELSGVPRQDDENAIDLVNKTAVVTNQP